MSNRSKLLFSALLAVAMFVPIEADAEYRYLCTSIPSACEYAPPTAPSLKTDVCYNSTGGVTLKGPSSCPTGSWPYYVEAGEVIDPITNEVAAYVPLDDACSSPGLCVEYEPHAGGLEEEMCCHSTGCVVGTTCGGTIWWCYDGVVDNEGAITCYMSEQIG